VYQSLQSQRIDGTSMSIEGSRTRYKEECITMLFCFFCVWTAPQGKENQMKQPTISKHGSRIFETFQNCKPKQVSRLHKHREA
jgi:hypothetical protein